MIDDNDDFYNLGWAFYKSPESVDIACLYQSIDKNLYQHVDDFLAGFQAAYADYPSDYSNIVDAIDDTIKSIYSVAIIDRYYQNHNIL